MDRVQSDEADIVSLEFARRLQHEYDAEMLPERTLVEEQREAYAASLKQDQMKRKRKAAKAPLKEQEKLDAPEPIEHKAVVMEPMTNTEPMPTMKELRELRIKALSNPSL
jgi:hypothetical protein